MSYFMYTNEIPSGAQGEEAVPTRADHLVSLGGAARELLTLAPQLKSVAVVDVSADTVELPGSLSHPDRVGGQPSGASQPFAGCRL